MMDVSGVKSSFWDYLSLLTGRFAVIPILIASVALATRILGKEGYGILSLFLLVSQIAFLFGINWTTASIIRYGREEFVREEKINEVFWGRNVLLMPCIVVSLITIFLFKDKIINYIGIPEWGLWLLILHILGLTLTDYTYYLQQAIGQLRLFATFQFAERLIILFGLSSIYIGLFQKDVLSVVAIYTLSSFLVVLLSVSFFNLKIFFPIEFKKEIIKRIFVFSYPIIFGSASAYIINWIDIIVIKKYMIVADVGVYSLAYQGMTMMQQISLATIILTGPMMVSFYTQGREDLIHRFVQRIVPQGTFVWSLFLSVITFLSIYLIPVLFGRNFSGAIYPFSLLMVALGFNLISCFYSPILSTYELIKYLTAVNILIAFVNLGGDFLLVPRIGISGAAIATLFSFAIGSILYLIISNHRLNLKGWKQILWVFPVIITVPCFIFVENIWLRFLGLIFIIVVSIKLARYFGIFSKEDLMMFDRIDMPAFVRSAIGRTYSFLAA